MSRARRIELMVILGTLSALGAASTDLYFAALPTMAKSFSAPPAELQLSLTTFMVGIAVGQLFTGALSDAFGRRRPLLFGIAFYALMSLCCALSPSAAIFDVVRFAQGLGAAAGISIARAIVRDLFEGREASKMYVRIFLVIGVVPVCAPSVGAFILDFSSWRWIFLTLTIWGLVVGLVVAKRLPETLAEAKRQPPRIAEMTYSFRQLSRNGRFVGYAVTLGLAHGMLVAAYAGAPFVLQDNFGLSPQQYGAVFLVAAMAMVVFGLLNGRLLQRLGEQRMLIIGCGVAVVGGVGVVASNRWGLALFLPSFTILFASWGLVPANAVALALRDHGSIAGAAAALTGLVQYVIAGISAPLAGINGNDVTTVGLVVVGIAAAATVTAILTVRSDRSFPINKALPIAPL